MSALALSCIWVLTALLGACERRTQPTPPATAASQPPNTVLSAPQVFKVATDASYPPFESLNERGDIVGFDVEIMTAVAEKAGIGIKFVNTPWVDLPDAIGRGDADIVISAMTITPERQKFLDFTNPYFGAEQLMAVRSGSKATKLGDLKTLRVGVQAGTIGDDAMQSLRAASAVRVKRFETARMALDDLLAGGVDAVVSDSGPILYYVVTHPGREFRTAVIRELGIRPYGIAVKKGNTGLLDGLNQGLSELRRDGTYDLIYGKYFPQPTAPTNASAELLPVATPSSASMRPGP